MATRKLDHGHRVLFENWGSQDSELAARRAVHVERDGTLLIEKHEQVGRNNHREGVIREHDSHSNVLARRGTDDDPRRDTAVGPMEQLCYQDSGSS